MAVKRSKLYNKFQNTKYYLVKCLIYIASLAEMRGQPKSDIDLYIIDVIKKLRTKHKLSQAMLAVKLDVSDAFIGQIENPKDRCKYSMDQLNKLAQIFDCSPRDFLPEKPIVTK